MAQALSSIRARLDKAGVLLSGLCAVHCVLGLALVSAIGLGGGVLLDPIVHETGLAIAVLIAAATLGIGIVRHRRSGPLVIAGVGIALMTAALAVGHGTGEALLTIAGVALLAFAHMRNLHHAA